MRPTRGMINPGPITPRFPTRPMPPAVPGPMRYGARDGAGPLTFNPRTGLSLGSFKRGGKVKKTGLYQLHKGEKVVPAKLSSLRCAK